MNPGSREPKPDAASLRPRAWHPCCDASGLDLVSPEIKDCVILDDGEPVSQSELQNRAGQLKAILRRAAAGQLRDEAWKPVSREPKLWELRWTWDDGSQLRGYFHEPGLEPDATILAKVHRKEIVENDAPATRRRQDVQIDEAGIRIHRNEGHKWGLDQSKPLT